MQQQGDRGRERGLASLVGKAYAARRGRSVKPSSAPLPSRGAPQMAYDANKHFGEMDDDARARLGQYAMAFDALPDEQKAQAYPQLAQQAQALGIPAPMRVESGLRAEHPEARAGVGCWRAGVHCAAVRWAIASCTAVTGTE